MKFKIWIALAFPLALQGCFEGDTKTSGSDDPDNVCQYVAYRSNINIQFRYNRTLPAHLSGNVNGTVPFSQCLLGNDTTDYTIVRNDDRTVTVSFWMRKDSDVYKEYFGEDGVPVENKMIHFRLFGQDKCGDSLSSLGQMSRVVRWQEVDLSKSSGCSAKGFTANVVQ